MITITMRGDEVKEMIKDAKVISKQLEVYCPTYKTHIVVDDTEYTYQEETSHLIILIEE